jgi:hypothetical protein
LQNNSLKPAKVDTTRSFLEGGTKEEEKEDVTFTDNQEEYNSLLTEKYLDTVLSSVTGLSPGPHELH